MLITELNHDLFFTSWQHVLQIRREKSHAHKYQNWNLILLPLNIYAHPTQMITVLLITTLRVSTLPISPLNKQLPPGGRVSRATGRGLTSSDRRIDLSDYSW